MVVRDNSIGALIYELWLFIFNYILNFISGMISEERLKEQEPAPPPQEEKKED